jgi:hypothetical protein
MHTQNIQTDRQTNKQTKKYQVAITFARELEVEQEFKHMTSLFGESVKMNSNDTKRRQAKKLLQ